jgi:hypothetical protein
MFEIMKKMCSDCPFGPSKAQRHMRNSLKPGRFGEICQSVWQGAYFPCHKTTKFDDNDERIVGPHEKWCKGAVEFVERTAKGRERRNKS